MSKEINLIKALRGIRNAVGDRAFQGNDEEVAKLLALANLRATMKSDELLEAAVILRENMVETPAWQKFAFVKAILDGAIEQYPGFKWKTVWIDFSSTDTDGTALMAIHLLKARQNQASE